MDPLATPADLVPKLPFVMDEGEEREALRALEELSDDARHYGSSKWVDAASTPRPVITLVIKAAARHMKNYEGYITSRAGDESVTFSDRGEAMGDAQFTAEERKRLAEHAGRFDTKLHTAGMWAYERKPRPRRDIDCYVPIEGSSEMFPYFADPVEPW